MRNTNFKNVISLSTDEMMRHWLLNLAVDCAVWLGLIFPIVAGEALNAREIPGCKTEDYAKGLIALFDFGMVKFASEVPGDDVGSRPGVLRILDRFLRLSINDPALSHEGRLLPSYKRNQIPGMQVSFELTLRGGEAWERLAEPDWTRFVSESTVEMSGDLVSPDRDLLMAYMGWYPELRSEQIHLETITWQTHGDFEILYWKRLPFVYHVSFVVQSAKARWHKIEPKWFREWWHYTRSWHKDPWQLAGWPLE